MNPNYKHTITLYNCLKVADSPDKKERWYRHELIDCYYKASVTRVDSGTSAGMQNTYTVRIPVSEWYLPYVDWAGLTEVEREKFFTMNLDDIVIVGICSEEITGSSGQAATQVLKRHKPDAFKVTAISDNTRAPLERHYRLGG